MSEKSTDTALVARLNSLSKADLKKTVLNCSKKLQTAQKQIQQKDKLIADFTTQKEQIKRQADAIISAAKEQAAVIRKEAERREEEAEHRIEEVNADVSRKLANANAEADSIVESRLNQAKADIQELEERREAAKRSAIALNKNIIERYDELISDVEAQISSFKDIQQSINDFNIEIESEDFKKFNLDDYVTPQPTKKKASAHAKSTSSASEKAAEKKTIKTSVKPILDVDNDDITINDEDLEALAYVFDDEFVDVQEEEEIVELDDAELLSDEDLDFLNTDFDFGIDDMDELDDIDDVDADDIDEIDDTDIDDIDEIDDTDIDDDISDFSFDEEDEDIFNDGTVKSFTDSFMAVRSSDDADDDLDDFDIDSILDDDDEEEEIIAPAPKMAVPTPARRHRRSSKSGNPGRWLS